MKPHPASRLLPWVAPIAFAAVVLLGWQWLHHSLPPMRRFMFPGLHQIATAFRDHGPALLAAARFTALTALGGFGLAILVSGAVSLALASSRVVRATLFPWIMGLQMVPIIVIAPILLLWVGPGAASVVIVTFLITFFPLVVNTTQGLLSVDCAHLDLFRMGRAARWQELLLLRAPAALPYFFTGLRIAAILAPIGALTADYLVGASTGGRHGLGMNALLFSARNEIPALYATALVGAALGFALVALVNLVARLVLSPWQGKEPKN